jgi:uncharacterized protein GlcG (DUF336 family)
MPELTLAQANKAIDTAIQEARRRDLPPVSVAVLDAGGHLKALQREDGVSFLRATVCQAKAWGALGLGIDSREIAQRHESDSTLRGFINALNAMSDGRVIPLPGGVLIRGAAGEVLGAIGVAGAASDDDEACALVACEAFRAIR